jgi:ubiquitin-like modifier-activating enzyme ATG7
MHYVLRVPAGSIRAEGLIKNVNTIEDFRTTDYNAMLNKAGKQVTSTGNK